MFIILAKGIEVIVKLKIIRYHNAAFLRSEMNTRQIQQEQHVVSSVAATPSSTINRHRVQIQRLSGIHR